MKGEKRYYEMDYKMPLAIVIGSEGEGVKPLVIKNCDFVVSIPQKGKVNSLNASVAAGIIIFEVLKSRSA
ncbi:MAG: 23S rRNA (guanosine(2251)-2'-O)-methyltransferase RlmB, partial [Nitrospirae bacterium]|nr:23S rRNA (guanosine(2251)-2'-O)-methyltransferase RlmB [Nitrospirota bacterium]